MNPLIYEHNILQIGSQYQQLADLCYWKQSYVGKHLICFNFSLQDDNKH